MARATVVFGVGDVAALARLYLEADGRAVAAFTLDAAFMDRDEFDGVPLVPFETIVERYPPQDFDMFVALGYSKINALRKEKYLAAKAAGYALPSIVSARASIMPRATIGENCFIFEDNTVQNFVEINDNVTLWSGNHVGHHSIIGAHCFIASHVVISGRVKIGESCFIGVNATLRDHITVGDRCVVGAGALLLADAEPEGVYIGEATERSRVPSSRLRRI